MTATAYYTHTMLTPDEAGNALARWMRTQGLTEQELVRRLAARKPPLLVSQSWINRVKDGRFRRFSGKTGAILKHANIRINVVSASAARTIIDDAIDDVWDGSLAGATALADLLRNAVRVGSRRRVRGHPDRTRTL